MGMVGEKSINVSTGTAATLDLITLRMDPLPTTAYLLLGTGCPNNCSFCPQGVAHNPQNYLSRITWPPFPWAIVQEKIIEKWQQKIIQRVCFQVTGDRDHLSTLKELGQALVKEGIPVNASLKITQQEDGEFLLRSGFSRISLALDCASSHLYEAIKGGNWEEHWKLLQGLSTTFPGQVATHLIVGLGETEKEMICTLQRLCELNITVGLFAFTPVRGTAMEKRPSPSMATYRRMQMARHLLIRTPSQAHAFQYSKDGRVWDWGMSRETLLQMMKPEAFETPGCPGCNRPYYNEKPGDIPYNYPRPLTESEYGRALYLAIKDTRQEVLPT